MDKEVYIIFTNERNSFLWLLFGGKFCSCQFSLGFFLLSVLWSVMEDKVKFVDLRDIFEPSSF